MNDSPSLLDLPDDEWCRRLDALLAQLPAATPNPNAPRGDAAADYLRGPLPPLVLADLAAAVASPVQLVADNDWRAVVVLRVYAAVVERRTGLVRAALLHDGGRLTGIAGPEPGIRLLDSPHGRDWTRDWLRAWCWRQGATDDPGDLLDAADEAAPALWHHACHHLDLHAMRRQVAAAMDYEPVAWRRAVRLAHALGRAPDHRHYNVAHRFAGQLDLLEREAPYLMAPWLLLACERALDARREPKAALRQWLRGTGAGSRAWKSLAASPVRAWAAWSRRRGFPDSTSLAETARLVDRCATAAPIPLPVIHALTERLDPLVPLTDERIGHYPFAMRASAEALRGGRWARFMAEFEDVDAWFDAERPVPDKLQRRRGWPWLVRKARAWAEMQRRRLLAREPLIPELPPVELDGHVFTAARTPFDLWNAGRQLRNCLGSKDQVERQATSESLIVLATRSGDGRTVAALELTQARISNRLRALRPLGFANGPAPRGVVEVAMRVAAHFDGARRRRLLPWWIGWPGPRPAPLAQVPMPPTFGAGLGALQIGEDGSVRLGFAVRDFTTRPVSERFRLVKVILGGQAQLLAERAVARAGAPVQTIEALAAAIRDALTAAPGLDHWLAVFRAAEPDDDAHDWDDDGPLELMSREEFRRDLLEAREREAREAVLELLDHLARDASQRRRRGRRQRSAT